MTDRLRKVIYIVLGIKFLIALISGLGYFSHPHIIRQVDTMSVGLNYWLRWSDGVAAPYFFHNFLPGSLGGGDTAGITPMEFPLLNLLIAPWFSLGHYWGFTASFMFVMCLNFGAFWWHYLEWRKVSKKMGDTALLMGMFGISSMFMMRVMPDFLSMILVSISCAYSFQKKSRLASFGLLSLGLLMKPTSAIALAVMFLKDFKLSLRRDFLWVILGIGVAGIYYTKGLQALVSFSDMNGYFKVNPLGPTEGISQLLNNLNRLPGFIFKSFFSRWALIPIVIAIFMAPKKGYLFITTLVTLQVLTIFAIDGEHGFIHEYYFIGCSFLLSFLIISIMENAHSKITFAIIFLMTIFTLERGGYRLKPIWKSKLRQDALSLMSEVTDLGKKSFYSTRQNPPELGLLFGQFQGKSKKATYEIQLTGDKNKCAPVVTQNNSFRVCKKN